jgi:mevalonate kinase
VKHYRANGKLLISGEYTVLDGSLALALPTQRGQVLHYKEMEQEELHWRSLNVKGEIWFEAQFNVKDLKILSASDEEKAKALQSILKSAAELSTTVAHLKGEVTTALEFPTDWGLGSSSTLICCVAQCFDIDPMPLHFKVSNGSGYDIACGMTDSAITYQLDDGLVAVNPINWKPNFSASLFFVYLNTKQKSSSEVSKYQDRKSNFDMDAAVDEISSITQSMLNAESVEVFDEAMVKHEELMSSVLGYPTVKQLYFSDYKGTVKSLGAWGGDFVLATGSYEERAYFVSKGYEVIEEYDALIL